MASRLPGLPGNPVLISVIALAVVATAASAVGSLFDDATTHRGSFHSLGLVVVIGAVSAVGLLRMRFHDRRLLAVGAVLIAGAAAVHLLIDKAA